MIYFFINIIFWTLALYGLLEIIKSIISMFTYKIDKPDGIYIIIAAKNQEQYIEGFLRSSFIKWICSKENEAKRINEVLLVDLESTDDTKNIMNKLSNESECLKSVSLDDCKNILERVSLNVDSWILDIISVLQKRGSTVVESLL